MSGKPYKIPAWRGSAFCSVLMVLSGCVHQPYSNLSQPVATSSKIAPSIAAAARRLAAGANPAALATGRVHSNAAGQIQVDVMVNDLSASAHDQLAASGLHDMTTSREMHIIEGWVLPRDIDVLAGLPFVIGISPPRYAITH